MKNVFFYAGLLIFLSCGSNQETEEDEKPTPETNMTSENDLVISNDTIETYTLETYQNEDSSWGYRVLNEGELLINQPHIPAIQGNIGFASQEKCKKAGDLVLQKLNKGIMPPTVSSQELDSLGVLPE